jgi:hypothetical protein
VRKLIWIRTRFIGREKPYIQIHFTKYFSGKNNWLEYIRSVELLCNITESKYIFIKKKQSNTVNIQHSVEFPWLIMYFTKLEKFANKNYFECTIIETLTNQENNLKHNYLVNTIDTIYYQVCIQNWQNGSRNRVPI